MRTERSCPCAEHLVAVALAVFSLAGRMAQADTVSAIYNSATDVPVTATNYTATGNTVNFTLNFPPATGTDLTVVNNQGLDFIVGTFDNLAQGQAVALSYGGVTYRFVANYYGGSGNDLVLVWGSKRSFAFGMNDGALGDNTTSFRQVPVAVNTTASPAVLFGKTVFGLAAGIGYSLAFCSDGTVAAWGGSESRALGNPQFGQTLVPVNVNTASGVSALYDKTVVGLSAGGLHNLALCSDGTVAGWGEDAYGELGNGVSGGQFGVPVAVNTNSGVSALYGKRVVAIAAGQVHSMALSSDGTVATWGYNASGELGDNTRTNRSVPVAVNMEAGVSALYGKTVVAIAAGSDHSLALCSDGTVAAWGLNFRGQLGDNTTTNRLAPVAVNTDSGVSALHGKKVIAIAAGYGHSLALCSDGTVAAWGYNYYGQLGDNSTIQRLVPVAVKTNSGLSALYGKTVAAISAGLYHSLALCSDGTATGWGLNQVGQLGNSSVSASTTPIAVDTRSLAPTQRFVRLSSGPWVSHTLALVAAPPAYEITLTSVQKPTNGAFQFRFTNTPGAFIGVLGATNSALPLTNWTPLDGLTEPSPGQFQFADLQATNRPGRIYRVRSP